MTLTLETPCNELRLLRDFSHWKIGPW
jgi:hypothetical protein